MSFGILNTPTKSPQLQSLSSGERRKVNLALETIVFDLYNSLALSKHNVCKQLFRKNDGEMASWRHGLKRVGPFAPSRRLWKYPNGSKPMNVGEKMPPKRSTSLWLRWSWRLCGLKRCLGEHFKVTKILRRSNFSKANS